MKKLYAILGAISALLLISSAARAQVNEPAMGPTSAVATPTPFIPRVQAVSPTEPIGRVTVGLYIKRKRERITSFSSCTAVILDEHRILTAAHCIEGIIDGVVAFTTKNMHDLAKQNYPDGNGTTVLPIFSTVMLAGYPGMHYEYFSEFQDLAVVTFEGSLPPGYEPAQFLSEENRIKELTPNIDTIIAGYAFRFAQRGIPSLHSPDLTKVDLNFSKYSKHQVAMKFEGLLAKEVCNGDSGGPAFRKITINGKDEYFVIGIFSHGNCKTFNNYTVVDEQVLKPQIRNSQNFRIYSGELPKRELPKSSL